MKLKFKLPLIFLLMFMIILSLGFFLLRQFFIDDYTMHSLQNSNSLHIGILAFLLVATGVVFGILTLYFHLNITKPIRVLNDRLKSFGVGHLHSSLYSKRKDEIGDLYNHFNEMEERLRGIHKEQVDMIAAIAHDLKTPLTTINGFVELLAIQKDLSEKDRQEYYSLILKKSRHISGLINGFSDFTKGELELESLEIKPVEALKFFESIAEEYETELSGLGFTFESRKSFSPGQSIAVNEHMMRRVFGNLFSNSVRYGEKKDLKIYLSGYVRENNAVFLVEDDGVGVPDQELSSLFRKFFTVDKSRQSESGGTGLGLASCKSIIERHGGEITAFHSNYGGMGIRFTLPLVI